MLDVLLCTGIGVIVKICWRLNYSGLHSVFIVVAWYKFSDQSIYFIFHYFNILGIFIALNKSGLWNCLGELLRSRRSINHSVIREVGFWCHGPPWLCNPTSMPPSNELAFSRPASSKEETRNRLRRFISFLSCINQIRTTNSADEAYCFRLSHTDLGRQSFSNS